MGVLQWTRYRRDRLESILDAVELLVKDNEWAWHRSALGSLA
jgi:hypothetical protein